NGNAATCSPAGPYMGSDARPGAGVNPGDPSRRRDTATRSTLASVTETRNRAGNSGKTVGMAAALRPLHERHAAGTREAGPPRFKVLAAPAFMLAIGLPAAARARRPRRRAAGAGRRSPRARPQQLHRASLGHARRSRPGRLAREELKTTAHVTEDDQ